MFHLLRQSSLLIVQNYACRRLQQHEIVAGNLFEAADKDAAGLVQHLRFNSGRNQTGDHIVQGLAVNRNVFVQYNQFDRQPFHAPV